MLRTLRISFMLMTVLLLIAGHASAAGYTWRLTNTPADWTSANWGDGANYPGAGDTATIGRKYYGNPATVNVTGSEAATYVNLGTNDVTSDGTLNIKNGGSLAVFYSTVGANGTGEINIEAGGTMTFSGTYHTTYIASGVGTTGTVNIQGAYEVGNLRIGDAGTGSTYISGNGSLTIDATRSVYIGYASGSTGLLEVSDSGTFDGVNLFIGNDVASDATFRVVGGDATLSLSSVLDMDQGAGTYEVHLDDTGISTLAVTGQARFGVSGGIIAPTALAGAQAGTYTVMTYDNYTGSPVLQDATGNWSMDVGATELTLTYVPEPTTMMLLGLGGLAMLKRRRK